MIPRLAYCTNVHAGSEFDHLRANLSRYAVAVKDRFAPEGPMGIGLWLAAPASKKLLEPTRLAEFADWLAAQNLIPFTLNGFPYGDFHGPVVKQRVYHPTWFDSQRLDYTLDLVEILHAILPEGVEGSISTLPISWRAPSPTDQQLLAATRHLGQVAEQLARLEESTGRIITVCLEPEPGCILQRCDDVVSFFNNYLCTDEQGALRKRYIGVCHDICHSAVMFEDQREVLTRYAEHGIRVGKVQVSSAVEVDFDRAPLDRRAELIDALASFAEDRYLHQTTVRSEPDAAVRFFDDLPMALAAAEKDRHYLQGKWRVHFHVPIYVDQFDLMGDGRNPPGRVPASGTLSSVAHNPCAHGERMSQTEIRLGTTQEDIRRCLQATDLHPALTHFEVETYAWSVLPAALQCAELADGIAREMDWLRDLMADGCRGRP